MSAFLRLFAFSGLIVLTLAFNAARAQSPVPDVKTLRLDTTLGANTTVLLQGWNAPNDGGGGILVSGATSGACMTAVGTTISGQLTLTMTDSTNQTATLPLGLEPGMGVSGPGLPFTSPPYTVQSYDVVTQTITLNQAAGSGSGGGTFTFTGDNGGSAFVNAAGYCFTRVNSTYSPKEWGALENSNGQQHNGNDDTAALQSWLNANQPHVAVPGNSRITYPLVCMVNQDSFSGPPRGGTTEINGPVPLFLITADNTGTGNPFTGAALLQMSADGCAIHNVGLIASDQGEGSYDTVDATGEAELVDGSYLYGGKINFNCTGGEDTEVFDSFLSSSVTDDLVGQCPNIRIVRNVIAQAGSKTSPGRGIVFKGTEALISNNTVETSSGDGIDLEGAQKVRAANNYIDRNGSGVVGAVGLRNDGSSYVSVCDNVFSYSGGATVPAPAAHIYLSGADFLIYP
jgi:hypothetical protein